MGGDQGGRGVYSLVPGSSLHFRPDAAADAGEGAKTVVESYRHFSLTLPRLGFIIDGSGRQGEAASPASELSPRFSG
ncbi:hypothetical protein KOW79_008755 [Hemibagrus wyckioides]|uniref:Uncharacterized protein n=1 Tax=Hemibagrus wyckioides TaxID=337641 RepID=A0A9D3NRW5_9TELE|nr:hypothetical protein KOW79_008755 [Hemibagrus wyckioides]